MDLWFARPFDNLPPSLSAEGNDVVVGPWHGATDERGETRDNKWGARVDVGRGPLSFHSIGWIEGGIGEKGN